MRSTTCSSSVLVGLVLFAGAFVLEGCRCARDEPPPIERTQKPEAPDRLRPGETLPGREIVFGMEVPSGMRVASRFPEVVQLSGHVKPEAVINYFRKLVHADTVELGTTRTVFPRARVKTDEKKRLYRIEVVSERSLTKVRIRDITPSPPVQGLNNAERWERAGRNPDGSLKDRLKAY